MQIFYIIGSLIYHAPPTHTVTYHHNPDEKEGVADKNEENGNLTHIKVHSIGLKERTVFYDILSITGVIIDYPESYPHTNIENRTTCTEGDEKNDDKHDNDYTTAKQEEVSKLHRHKRQGKLNLQE